MHNHNHNQCNHQLKYCPECDSVFCEKCGKEWKVEKYNFYTPNLQCPSSTSTPVPMREIRYY